MLLPYLTLHTSQNVRALTCSLLGTEESPVTVVLGQRSGVKTVYPVQPEEGFVTKPKKVEDEKVNLE